MLDPAQIATLLEPYLPQAAEWSDLYPQLALYLDLLLKWNARTNLTAIRDPEEIVRRHFGESLFLGNRVITGQTNSLLDFGSGAGFPGIPIQLLHPTLHVTLAESQGKKSAFLREVTRALKLPTEIWPHRVESMPPSRRFDTVTLRAVDNMDAALAEAARRSTHQLLILTTLPPPRRGQPQPEPPQPLEGFTATYTSLPGTNSGVLLTATRHNVPRGTIPPSQPE